MKQPIVLRGMRRRLFGQLIANAATQASVLLLNALLIRFAFDHLLDGDMHRRDLALWIGLSMVLGAVVTGWLQRSERIIAEKLGQSYVHSLRMRLFRQVTRMNPRLLQKKRRGAVMLKFIGDLAAVRRWVSLGLVRLIVSGAIISSTLAILSLIDPLLAGVAAVLIFSGLLINARIGESLRGAALETRRRRSRLSANISEKLSRMPVVQVFGRTEQEVRKVRKQSHHLRTALVERAAKIGSIRGITHGGTALAAAAVLMIGVFRVNGGHTTSGTVAAALAVLGFLVPALKNLGRVYEYYQEFRVARQKLDQFLIIPAYFKIGAGLPELAEGPGRLVFKNVTVRGVVKDASADIAPGSVAVLVGPNGAGKSTLIGVATRLVPLDSGKILIDGQDISKVRLQSVNQAVGVVSPDLPLLAGSLEMNLRYRNPGCASAELDRVKRMCGIDGIIPQLPKGERTRIHEGGHNLSAGQRQRIMLARALLGTPRILLLDEVDAHLDQASIEILHNVIRTYPGTVLWVTHQQVHPPGVDVVWRLENGCFSRVRSENYPLKMAG